jgi:hypothetical protein
MTKRLLPFFVFFFVFSALYGQSPENPVSQLDNAVKSLAAELQKKIPAGGDPKVALGVWTHNDSMPVFSSYWAAQLAEELANIPDRSFVPVSGGTADWIVSGEIVALANIIRVYTRLIRPGEQYIVKVRGYDGNTGAYGFRAWLTEPFRNDPDEYENDDDFSSAKTITVGTPQQHSFTTGDDVDWVKFEIDRSGSYTIRVRGVNTARLDTCVELYDSNRSFLDEDDDGGDSRDSRLTARLRAGTYYLKVECLDDEPAQPYTITITAD